MNSQDHEGITLRTDRYPIECVSTRPITWHQNSLYKTNQLQSDWC